MYHNIICHYTTCIFDSRSRNSNTDKSQVEIRGDLLIGADGAHSAMRREMLKRPMTNFSQTYIDHGYMELRIPAKENGQVDLRLPKLK